MTASEIISPAPGPIMWAPKIRSVFLSDKIFTIPSVFEIAFALEFAKNGKTPFVYSMPRYLNIYLFSLVIIQFVQRLQLMDKCISQRELHCSSCGLAYQQLIQQRIYLIIKLCEQA